MTELPSQPSLYLGTSSAQLFMALTKTLGDPELLAALKPQLEVWPGMSCFQIPAYVEAQARLAALDPAELHRRIVAQGVSPEALTEVLLTFHLPMTGVVATTPGFTVFVEVAEMGVGRRVWLKYSPEGDEVGAVEAFRRTFFPDEEEWAWYGRLKRVVPGRYRHSLAPPGQEDEFFEHLIA